MFVILRKRTSDRSSSHYTPSMAIIVNIVASSKSPLAALKCLTSP